MVKVLLLALLLAGCASAPTVEYRVAEIPEPPVITRPELPVLNMPSGADAGTVIQFHRETIKILQAYAKELEAALNAYRKKDPK